MRQMEQDGEHIWLRQSVTFTVSGQTRTVEIAIPLRPGASAEDVEALLSEADAGMERLSRRLDARVSALQGASAPASAPTPSTPAPASPTAPAAPAASAAAPSSASASAQPPVQPLQSAPPSAHTPARPTGESSAPAPAAPANRPAPPPSRPTAPPAARPTTPAPVRGAASGSLASTSGSHGPDLTRPEFISGAQELGMNVKQAMERLNVRSLEGLNLREALEALRRQAVRGDVPPPAPSAPPASPAPVRASAPSSPAPSAARVRDPGPSEPRYFDEEDDLDVTFAVDGDAGAYGAPDEEFASYADGEPSAEDEPDLLDEIDELDLDDVPDFGPPPSASRASAAAPRRAATPRPALPAEAEPSTPSPDVAGLSGARTRALQLVGQMRSARGGGVPSSQQRTAYRNVVARELGEPEAAALVRGLWRTTPDRLSTEQLDALVSWGKQDTFGEEAALVLAELRAERERATASASGEPSPAGEAPRTAQRGRGAGTGRSAPGGR